MNISAPFIKRPIGTSLIMLALLIAGFVAYSLLPISSLPEVEYPTMRVLTFYPGASPEVTASSITAPLERQFGQMPGLLQMNSSSSMNVSIITLQFGLDVLLDIAEQEVQAAINAASNFLPSELPFPPIYSKVNPADTPVITLALTSKTIPLSSVEDYAETRLLPRLSQQTGVGLVSISGGERPAIRIQANPTALASYGLSFEDLRAAIVAANVNAAKGSFDGPRLSYTIHANDQLLSAKDYQRVILRYQNGAPIRIANVATVLNGTENTQLAAWQNLNPAIIINIQRQPGANVIQVVNHIQQLLSQVQAALPNGIDLQLLNDRTITIRAAIHDVQMELLLAVVLVVLVIFIFLHRLRATLIPSISVPLSLIGSFILMYLWGFSINNLTLMALTVAAGFVVDDAIVMIENITRFIEQGETAMAAAFKGAGQIGFTIVSLTVSLIAVLIPLIFMQDIVGRLFREFALTLAIAILISGIISLTLTPMLCAYLLGKNDESEHWLSRRSKAILNDLITYYRHSLQWVLAHPLWVWLIFLISFLLSVALFYIIPKGFFPIQDTGVIQAITDAPQSISFPAMRERQRELAKIILQDPAVSNLASFIGIDGTNTTLNNGRMLITLKAIDDRDVSAIDVINRLQTITAKIPGIRLYMQPVQDLTLESRVSRTLYQYTIGSPITSQVEYWSQMLLQKMKDLPQITDVSNDLQAVGLETRIDVNRDTLARLQLNLQAIDDTLYDAFGQRQISTMFTQRSQYRVILEMSPNMQNEGHNALSQLYLTTPLTPSNTSIKPIPFSIFSKVSQGFSPLIINRQDQFPVATLSFNLPKNTPLGNAIAAIDQVRASLTIPSSVETGFAGAAKIFQRAMSHQGWLLLAAIFTVYIILGVLYESYIHPITILSTLPSASLGALLALVLFGYELSVIALIGIILVIGIVMKNAIMMIDFSLDLERTSQKDAIGAIFEAALLRFRPILMTTLAAMLGAVPLAFGSGMGSELRRPLGIVIIGGLILSQLLTLYTTPIIYVTFDRWAKKLMRRSATENSADFNRS